ncbi:cyclin-SDS [Pyrus ussuriensis x Pyrus communis]|uniref:Cyclin-SDS n=1 Tax=Pyrus ussuriensis x Pyrus communis TaxID=2448454 RepID=A0A5N5GX28_9ROSA|nr:cyclin-SDS [Pyrus ussuriensis x Pyrus communis]KAB2620176.1 cyclin-SDS [Pyrus ussuriensis x Pyrus communis]KAB2624138.1 cyclin-SDS [Pyrus ussuriensis x Pyrus communis]
MKCKSICALQNLETTRFLEAKKELRSVLRHQGQPQISPVMYSSLNNARNACQPGFFRR